MKSSLFTTIFIALLILSGCQKETKNPDVVETDEHSLLLLGDVLYPSSQENLINTGIEYGFMGRYFIRGGYRQLLIDDSEGGLTLGAGVNVYNIIVDYAYSDRGQLDYVQYFSVGVKF